MAAKIRVGLVGIGRAGWCMHKPELDNFKDMFEYVAACDTDFDRTKPMVDAFGCKAYADIKDMLKDKNVELVAIASRSPEHTPHALLSLKAGKYTFVEKPIGLNSAEAMKLKKAAAKYPGKLFFRHNRRFEPTFTHIREIMASGVLGEVYEIQLRRYGYQRRDDWQTIIGCGGGMLNNWGPHLVDHALQFLDSPVKDIWGDLKKVAAVGDAEDHFKFILRGKNGRVVDVEVSGGAATSLPTYTVLGTRGALTSDEREIHIKHIDPKQKLAKISAKKESPSLAAGFGNSETLNWVDKTIKVEPAAKCDMHHIWKYLYQSIRSGKPFPIKTDEAVEVVKVTEKIKKVSGFFKK